MMIRYIPILVLLGSSVVGCSGDQSGKRAAEHGKSVNVSCAIKKESLGVDLKVGGDYGSVTLELTNKGSERMSLGSDVYLFFDNSDFKVGLLTQGVDRDDQIDRALMFATAADLLSGVEDGKLVKYIYGASGQGLGMDSSTTEDYKGLWAKSLPAQGKATIAQQLMTWPQSNTGWVATPELRVGTDTQVAPLRVIAGIGDSSTASFVVPITVKDLNELVSDQSRPLAVREWAVGWLCALPGDQGWEAGSKLLTNAAVSEDIRKAAARWMATQSPPQALKVIDDVMWASATPKDLQLICFYSLTWSGHDEAKPLIKKAAQHSHEKIRESASSRSDSE